MNNLCDTLNPQKEIKIKKRTGAIVGTAKMEDDPDRPATETNRKKETTKICWLMPFKQNPQKEVEIIEMRAKCLVVIF